MSRPTLCDSLRNYTFTEITCNICKTKLNITSTDLMCLWATISIHESGEAHKIAAAGVDDVNVGSTLGLLLLSQLSPPRPSGQSSIAETYDKKVEDSVEHSSPIQDSENTTTSSDIDVDGSISNEAVDNSAVVKPSDRNSQQASPVASDTDVCSVSEVSNKETLLNNAEKHAETVSANTAKDSSLAIPEKPKDETTATYLIPTKVKTIPFGSEWCNVCSVPYPMCDTILHCKGKKHQEFLNLATSKKEIVPLLSLVPQFVKAPEKKITPLQTLCSVCSIWVSYPPGEADHFLSIHNEGKKHQDFLNLAKKEIVPLLSLVPQVVIPAEKTKTPNQEWCSVCSIWVSYPPGEADHYLSIHNEGRKHKMLKSLPNTGAIPRLPTVAQVPASEKPSDTSGGIWCDVCSTMLTPPPGTIESIQFIKSHSEGTKHKSLLANLLQTKSLSEKPNFQPKATVETVEKNRVWCDVCSIWLTHSPLDYKGIAFHVQGKKHQTLMDAGLELGRSPEPGSVKTGEIPTAQKPAKVVDIPRQLKGASPVKITGAASDDVLAKTGLLGKYTWCDVCSVWLPFPPGDVIAIELHNLGSNHKSMVNNPMKVAPSPVPLVAKPKALETQTVQKPLSFVQPKPVGNNIQNKDSQQKNLIPNLMKVKPVPSPCFATPAKLSTPSDAKKTWCAVCSKWLACPPSDKKNIASHKKGIRHKSLMQNQVTSKAVLTAPVATQPKTTVKPLKSVPNLPKTAISPSNVSPLKMTEKPLKLNPDIPPTNTAISPSIVSQTKTLPKPSHSIPSLLTANTSLGQSQDISSEETDKRMWCNVCSIWLPFHHLDSISITLHNRSKTHVSLIPKLLPSTTNVNHSEITSDMKVTWCSVCSVWMPHDSLVITAHNEGDRHRSLVKDLEMKANKPKPLPKILRGPPMKTWCSVCSIHITGDTKVLNDHLQGKKHASKINLNNECPKVPNECPKVTDDIMWCKVCAVRIPRFYWNFHVHGEVHKGELAVSDAEHKPTDVMEPMTPASEWCAFCTTWFFTIDKKQHYQGKTHQESEARVSIRKLNVFEYKPNCDDDKDAFTCIVCSDLHGECIVKENQAMTHCCTEDHVFLAKTRMEEQKKCNIAKEVAVTALTAPKWQCQLCWQILPMTTAISYHIQSTKHCKVVDIYRSVATFSVDGSSASAVIVQEESQVNNTILETSSLSVSDIEEEQVFEDAARNYISDEERTFEELTNGFDKVEIFNEQTSIDDGRLETLEMEFIPASGSSPVDPALTSGDYWYCLICSSVLAGHVTRAGHLNSSRHRLMMRKFAKLGSLRDESIPFTQRMTLMHKLVRRAEATFLYGMTSRPQLEVSLDNSIFCRLCNKLLDCPYDAVVHVLWQNHQQRIKAVRSDWLAAHRLHEIDEDTFRCESCRCSFAGMLPDAVQHVEDASHRELLEMENMSYSEAVAKVLDRMKVSEGEHFDPGHLADCGDLLYCNVCDDFLNTPRDAFKHVQASGHVDAVILGSQV